MRTHFRPLTTIAICLILPWTAGDAVGEVAGSRQTFTSTANGYSVTFPAEWKRIGDEDIQRGVALVHQNPKARNIEWDAAYQSPGRMTAFSYPYVILQVTPYQGGREPRQSQISDAVKAMTGNRFKDLVPQTGNSAIDNALATASMGVAQYDPANHVVYQPLSMSAPVFGEIKGVVISHFGRRALVSVMCYDRASNFDRTRPAFDQIAASFQFDKSAAYDPGQASMSDFARGAIIGAAVAVVAAAILIPIYRRQKSTR